MNSSHKYIITAAIIIILHLVGIVGMDLTSYGAIFEQVSWVNLLISFGLLMYSHEGNSSTKFLAFAFITFSIGLIAEIIGVNTGLIFGSYRYTPTLGAGLIGVPLMIGVNWVLLTYTTATVSNEFKIPTWTKVLMGATLMTFLDLLLEGFAIRHHLWSWDHSSPPVQNYVAWFVISLALQSIYQLLIPETRNKLAQIYLWVIIIFLVADKIL